MGLLQIMSRFRVQGTWSYPGFGWGGFIRIMPFFCWTSSGVAIFYY